MYCDDGSAMYMGHILLRSNWACTRRNVILGFINAIVVYTVDFKANKFIAKGLMHIYIYMCECCAVTALCCCLCGVCLCVLRCYSAVLCIHVCIYFHAWTCSVSVHPAAIFCYKFFIPIALSGGTRRQFTLCPLPRQ